MLNGHGCLQEGVRVKLVVLLECWPSEDYLYMWHVSWCSKNSNSKSIWMVSFASLRHNLKGGLIVLQSYSCGLWSLRDIPSLKKVS